MRAAVGLVAACVALGGCRSPHGGADGDLRAVTRRAAQAQSKVHTAPWTFDGNEGVVLSTPHYRVHTTIADPRRAERLAGFIEDRMADYRSGAGVGVSLPPPRDDARPLDVFIFATRGEWERMTRQLLGEQAAPFLAIPRGGYTWAGRVVMYELSPASGARDTLSLLAHEGWHQYAQAAMTDRLPTWLDEGLATVMEGHRTIDHRPEFNPWTNTERYDELRTLAERGELWSLDRLLRASPGTPSPAAGSEDALAYYAQVWALTLYLTTPPGEQSDGSSRRGSLAGLLTDAATGLLDERIRDKLGRHRATLLGQASAGHAVFEACFGPVETHESAFHEFVRAMVAPGTRERIVRGQSPFGRDEMGNSPSDDRGDRR